MLADLLFISSFHPLETLLEWDREILFLANGFHSPYWDNVMSLLSDRFTWVPMYLALFWVILHNLHYSRLFFAVLLVFAVAFALSDYTCASVIRSVIERPRPSRPDSGISEYIVLVNGYRGGHYGFPSCHAANSAMLATLIGLLFKNKLLTCYIIAWAVVHTYTRLYLGVHYPTDVLAGGLMGCLISSLTYKVVNHRIPLHACRTSRMLWVIPATGLFILFVILLLSYYLI